MERGAIGLGPVGCLRPPGSARRGSVFAGGERVEATLAGDGLDFHEQARVAMAFQGIVAVIAQYPDADTAELREALVDAGRALLRPRPRRQPPVTVTIADAPTT